MLFEYHIAYCLWCFTLPYCPRRFALIWVPFSLSSEVHCLIFCLSIFVLWWIRQPKPRGCMFVFVCKYALGRSRATQPPNLWLCLLRHLGFLTSPHAIQTRSGCHPNSFRLLRWSTFVPHPTMPIGESGSDFSVPHLDEIHKIHALQHSPQCLNFPSVWR